MIIVPKFEIKYNEETGICTIISMVACKCPLCGGAVYHRDYRSRKSKKLNGEIWLFMLRRLLCEDCAKLHTEIPDIIQPFKHYDSETIQSVIDGGEKARDCVADESTINRWKADFVKAAPDIEQRLASAYIQETDTKAPILSSTTILSYIRAMQERWLAFVMVLLINKGHKLCTRFAFCPPDISDIVCHTTRKGDKLDVKTIKNTG
jgi:hypothetical protein